jgi:Na+/proline symporter
MMTWIDWIVVAIPLAIVIGMALKAQTYVKSVADFLAAGRVAGRYVLCVAGAEANMGLVSVVALWEMYYNCGFAVQYWGAVAMPIGLAYGLTGYCTYRFRETRALTMGQFLEIRYNRKFRVFACFLQAFSGVMNYAIFPAVSARVLMYFWGLPAYFYLGDWRFSTFGTLMFIFLGCALFLALLGGQITIMVTDCIQGILSYPFYAILVFYVIYRFNWWTEVTPTLAYTREPGTGVSMLNPFDIYKMRNFNLFYVFTGIFSGIFNRITWGGAQGYSVSALNPHEQKMAGLFGTWRAGFSVMMITMLAVAAFVVIHNADFRKEAKSAHYHLTRQTVEELAADKKFDHVRTGLLAMIETGKVSDQLKDTLKKSHAYQGSKIDFDHVKPDDYRAIASMAVGTVDKKAGTQLNTLYGQMLVPITLRELLPVGITGILCALMIFLMVSTDTTYMHSWGSIIAQDIILPFFKKRLTPKQHITLLRCTITFVVVVAFMFSFFFSQMDYVLMFFAITGAIWTAGAGPVTTFGLYWKKGTTAAAFATLITGSTIAVGGILCQQHWANHIYPFFERYGLVGAVTGFFESVSAPFNPIIVWKVTPDRFPINSIEMTFIAVLSSVILYVVVSLLTCKKDYNMEKLLHRGKYADGVTFKRFEWSFRNFFLKIAGIDPNYTRSDRILAYSVFIYTFCYAWCGCFLGILIWNTLFYRWPIEWWGIKFFITGLVVPGIIAVISTVWFAIGGSIDLYRLFKRLDAKVTDDTDDGTVEKDEEK